jgi:hypothetical protein
MEILHPEVTGNKFLKHVVTHVLKYAFLHPRKPNFILYLLIFQQILIILGSFGDAIWRSEDL